MIKTLDKKSKQAPYNLIILGPNTQKKKNKNAFFYISYYVFLEKKGPSDCV